MRDELVGIAGDRCVLAGVLRCAGVAGRQDREGEVSDERKCDFCFDPQEPTYYVCQRCYDIMWMRSQVPRLWRALPRKILDRIEDVIYFFDGLFQHYHRFQIADVILEDMKGNPDYTEMVGMVYRCSCGEEIREIFEYQEEAK